MPLPEPIIGSTCTLPRRHVLVPPFGGRVSAWLPRACLPPRARWLRHAGGPNRPAPSRRSRSRRLRRHGPKTRVRKSSSWATASPPGSGCVDTQSYPGLLQERMNAEGFTFEVVNAGVSGDTSAGGLRRLDWSLQEDVRILVVALGANDGLRGLSVQDMKQNIGQIIEAARAKGVRRDPRGHGSAAELRPRVRRVVPAGVPRARAEVPRASSCHFSWTGWPECRR